MPPTPASDRDPSVSLTLALFCAIVGFALYVTHDLGAARSLIDRPAGDEETTAFAGPTFVQHESERAAEPTSDEVDEELGLAPDGDDEDDDDFDAVPTRIADVSGEDGADSTDAVKPVHTTIEDVCVDGTDASCKRWAMDGFYDALGVAAGGKGLARASLWGDSVSADGTIAAGIRGRLDKTYGDGGAGFIFLSKPSRWYANSTVRQWAKGWVVHSIISHSDPGGYHGYGGAAFAGTAGDTASFKTAKKGPGSKVSHVELYYLQGPKGGEADVLVDGEVAASIDSHAETAGSGFVAVDVDDGAHEIEIKVTRGRLDAFGITMERASGVVVDSLGIVSNTAKNMGDIKPAHWREQIAHRDADLMMILLGTNESQWVAGPKALKEYQKQWQKILGSLRKGNPDGTCLVLGTLDAGELVDGKKFVGRPNIDGMLKVERAAAKAEGCAFWDSRAFMGGKDSARAWRKQRLMSGDFAHLTRKGGKVLGSGIVEAIEAGYSGRASR
jgi:lysophospholipase L1-like esterase